MSTESTETRTALAALAAALKREGSEMRARLKSVDAAKVERFIYTTPVDLLHAIRNGIADAEAHSKPLDATIMHHVTDWLGGKLMVSDFCSQTARLRHERAQCGLPMMTVNCQELWEMLLHGGKRHS